MSLKKNKIYFEGIYIFFLGLITSFCLPPYNYWIVNFITFSLLFIFLIKNSQKNIKFFFFNGYIFGFGYFISNLYWIPISLSYDKNFDFLIPFALFLIPAFLSLFYAIAFLIFKIFLKNKSIFTNILIFSLTVGLSEFTRGTILSGFPWNLIAYTFSENIQIIQIISIIGVYAFNTILVTIFTIPSIFYLSKKKYDFLGFFLTTIICIFFLSFGHFKINNFENLKPKILNDEIKVLSTNIPIKRFYTNLDEEEILIKLINLSNPSHKTNTVFVWPEGIIPDINLKSLKYEYDYLLKNTFSKNHKIILGINDENFEKNKKNFFNSLSIIDNEANVIYKYYKNKLVPFGEFLPLENVLSKIGLKSLTNNYQSYSASSERKLFQFKTDENLKILPLICYEIIYSGKLSENNDYNFIINISEDGWFGNSIGPYQHFAHSIFRSVEYGKYTLRSANNGISAIIDPSGGILDILNVDNEGVISIKEFKNVNKTPFSTYGNKIYFLIILLYIFLIFSFKKLNNE